MNSIIEKIHSPFPGRCYYIPETGSTMEDARILIASERPEPAEGTVIRAGLQTAGRGRIPGRRWESVRDENLLFTILIRRDSLNIPLSAFPLAAGLAAALTAEGWGLAPQVKWPNDLLCDGKKLCGILCETAGAYLSAGIGFNCNQTGFPDTGKRPAVSLKHLTGREHPPAAVLEDFLDQLHQVLSGGFWRSGVEERLFGRAEEVALVEGAADSGIIEKVRIIGIGSMGQLLVKGGTGEEREVFSGEIIYGR